jgi:hypothetical protein
MVKPKEILGARYWMLDTSYRILENQECWNIGTPEKGQKESAGQTQNPSSRKWENWKRPQ